MGGCYLPGACVQGLLQARRNAHGVAPVQALLLQRLGGRHHLRSQPSRGIGPSLACQLACRLQPGLGERPWRRPQVHCDSHLLGQRHSRMCFLHPHLA